MDLNSLITMGLLVLGPKIIGDYSISCHSDSSRDFIMITFNNEPQVRVVSPVRTLDQNGVFELIEPGDTELQTNAVGTHQLVTPKMNYTWNFPQSQKQSFLLKTSSDLTLKCIFLR
jgi:hypothetical protein